MTMPKLGKCVIISIVRYSTVALLSQIFMICFLFYFIRLLIFVCSLLFIKSCFCSKFLTTLAALFDDESPLLDTAVCFTIFCNT